MRAKIGVQCDMYDEVELHKGCAYTDTQLLVCVAPSDYPNGYFSIT
jgi:hypothetical protein